MSAKASQSAGAWNPLAPVLTWIIPGLGHVIIGERKRGAVIGGAVLVLWTLGLFIGGISVIDRQNPGEPQRFNLWYLGQMLMAPSVAVELYHHNHRPDKSAYAESVTEGQYTFEPSFGRTYEMGVLYTALAGMLNLLVMLDVLYREPGHRESRRQAGKTIDFEKGGGA